MTYNVKLSEQGKIIMEQTTYTHCLRCGRLLKSEESRIYGYGLVCREKCKPVQENTLF